MARFAAGALCLLLLAPSAVARRTKESESVFSDDEEEHAEAQALGHVEEDAEEHGEEQAAWTAGIHLKELEAASTWCTHKDETLECEEGLVIEIRTAFYSRREEGDCKRPLDANRDFNSCKGKDALGVVKKLCNGQRKCLVSPGEHSTCPQNPFTFIRVRYYCVAGHPKNMGSPVTRSVEKQVEELQQMADENAPFKPGTTKEQTWCTSQEERLFCEGGQTITVRTAMYNRNQLNSCFSPTSEAIFAKPVVCRPTAYKKYSELCDGKAECRIEPHEHFNCPDRPFTFLRIVYKCGSADKAVVQGTVHQSEEE